jgi:hypothetical protein
MQAETHIRTGFLADETYVPLRDAIMEPEVKLLYVIAYHAGVRKNELLQIKWEQVDLAAEFIDLMPTPPRQRKVAGFRLWQET